MLVCDDVALIMSIVVCPVTLSTQSELTFMLPIFDVSNISFWLTFFLYSTDVK